MRSANNCYIFNTTAFVFYCNLCAGDKSSCLSTIALAENFIQLVVFGFRTIHIFPPRISFSKGPWPFLNKYNIISQALHAFAKILLQRIDYGKNSDDGKNTNGNAQ